MADRLQTPSLLEVRIFSCKEIELGPDPNLFSISDKFLSNMQEIISNNGVVVIKQFLSPDKARLVRKAALRFATGIPSQNPVIEVGVTRNYWRFDNNPEKSSIKSIANQYRAFYWNEDPFCGALQLLKRLARFRNVFSGLRENFALEQPEDGYISVPTLVNYPQGGGYLQTHRDPESAQKAVLMIKMSKQGIDYKEGGLYIENGSDNNRVMLDQYLDPGDLYIIRPSCRHGVAPIDPSCAIDLKDDSGRWMMMSSLVLASSL
jgi:hypothetical protein